MSSRARRRIAIWTSIVAGAASGIADAQRAVVTSPANAKGIVVLRADFPSRGALHSFGLEISLDGHTFVNAAVGPTRGLRLSGEMVEGASDRVGKTVLAVPVVGRFGATPRGFLFPEPGIYQLRWDIAFRDGEVGTLKIDQTVRVTPPTNPDLEFVARIGHKRFWKEVLALDPPEGSAADLLALGLIGEFLEHAEDDPGEDGSVSGKLEWADPLMDLAKELADSSYAPYGAFYAARLYLQNLIRIPELGNITPLAQKHELYSKANDALLFTLERADSFLKPRTLCTLAYLRLCAASWDDADRFLTEAEECADGQANVLPMIQDIRNDLVRLRERDDPPQPRG